MHIHDLVLISWIDSNKKQKNPMNTPEMLEPRSEEERKMFARLWEEQEEIYRQGGYYRCPPGMDPQTYSRYRRYIQLNSKTFQAAEEYLAQQEKEEAEELARKQAQRQ